MRTLLALRSSDFVANILENFRGILSTALGLLCPQGRLNCAH